MSACWVTSHTAKTRPLLQYGIVDPFRNKGGLLGQAVEQSMSEAADPQLPAELRALLLLVLLLLEDPGQILHPVAHTAGQIYSHDAFIYEQCA